MKKVNNLLINLSNHPSYNWSEQQLIAARPYGTIIDMPFPVIDEKGDENYIISLAKEHCSNILKYTETSTVAVHLMGEMTFTFALVKQLQALGITCIASTSKRMVIEDCNSGTKEVTFQFERFRKY